MEDTRKPKSTTSEPGTAKRTQKAREILISAARTFRGHGFATASMAQIAEDLGMQKSNLYYYFKSKEEILFASHVHLMTELSSLVTKTDAAGGTTEYQLRSLTEGFVLLLVDEFQASALTQNIRGMTPDHQAEIIRMRDKFESHYRFLIQCGIDDGSFRPMNVKLVGFAIFGALNWIHRWHDKHGSNNSASIAVEFADFVLAGLR